MKAKAISQTQNGFPSPALFVHRAEQQGWCRWPNADRVNGPWISVTCPECGLTFSLERRYVEHPPTIEVTWECPNHEFDGCPAVIRIQDVLRQLGEHDDTRRN